MLIPSIYQMEPTLVKCSCQLRCAIPIPSICIHQHAHEEDSVGLSQIQTAVCCGLVLTLGWCAVPEFVTT